MRNRAKCKKCNSIIESFHSTDMVFCACGEIYVDGGEALKCGAGDFSNFLRVDDKGNEIIVKVQENEEKKDDVNPLYNGKPSKSDLVKILEEMCNSYERLPQIGMESYCTNYDLYGVMMIVLAIVKSDVKD